MARSLSPELDACMRDPSRQPAYQVEIYDLRSTAEDVVPTRIGDVVRALQGLVVLPAIVGPRVFTDEVTQLELLEQAGDYVGNGIAASSLEFQVIDAAGTLDPLLNPPTDADPTAEGRWLRQGNVLVVREGDTRVDPAEWAITFTGKLRGQVGADRNRTTGNALLIGRASTREVDFLRLLSTSEDFPQATPFSDIATSLAEIDLGLDPDEIALPSFSARTTKFTSTQFLDASPLVSLAQLLFLDGYMPRFDGMGRLTATSGSLTKGPARAYEDGGPIISIVRPMIDSNGPNEVVVVGLNPNKRQVLQGRQTLATAGITTGFFSSRADIPVRWSGDGTLQALAVKLEIDASVADGIFGFGGETFVNGPLGPDGGSTHGTIRVDGGLEASVALASLVAVAWIVAHAKSDAVVAVGTGTVFGHTISLGRLVEGAIGQTLFTILGRIGRGQYRVTGKPYEYVFEEIKATARVTGLRDEDLDSRRIENHLLTTQAECEAVALRTLQRLRAQQNARSVRAVHDLALEPDDVFSVGVGAASRSYLITAIRRRLASSGTVEATYDAFEISLGVRP